jgi:hypothetical protein
MRFLAGTDDGIGAFSFTDNNFPAFIIGQLKSDASNFVKFPSNTEKSTGDQQTF